MSLNLLPSQAKFQVDKIRATTLSRRVVKYFLILWVLSVIIIMLVLQGENVWLSNLNAKYKVAVNDYLSSSQEIVVSQTIKFRTKLLAKVLADRFEYANAFTMVGNIFDKSITIKDFELKEKKYFVVSVIASTNDAMKQVESRVDEVNSGAISEVKNIVIKSVLYSKVSNDWLVSMEVYLK